MHVYMNTLFPVYRGDVNILKEESDEQIGLSFITEDEGGWSVEIKWKEIKRETWP